MGKTRTIAVANQKGGTGKTTTAVNLSHGAARSGLRTLLIDLDSQGNVADVLGLDKEPGIYRLLAEDVPLMKVARSSERSKLDVALSDKSTAQAEGALIQRSLGELTLRRVLRNADSYDLVFLDCPPSMGIMQVAAFIAADKLLIPTKLNQLSVIGVKSVIRAMVSLAGKLPDINITLLGVLPTFWERVTRETHTQLKLLADEFEDLVYPPIPLDTKVREASAHGLTLWEYAPGCRALEGAESSHDELGGYSQALHRLLRDISKGA